MAENTGSKPTPEILAIKNLFKDYWEDCKTEDTLMKKLNLTILHQIVLQIIDIDLKTQLSITTANIDTPCVMGRTPLAWATIWSDLQAMRLLLNFGADIYILKQPENRNIIYKTAKYGFLEALSLLLEAVNHPITLHSEQKKKPDRLMDQADSFGLTPLHITIDFRKIKHALLLVQYNYSLNPIPGSNIATIHCAIQFNKYEILNIILGIKARTDVKDDDQMGVLHLTGRWGDLETILILLRYNSNIPLNASTADTDMYSITPMKSFDIARKIYMEEDTETFARTREVFIKLMNEVNAYRLEM